MKNMFFAVKINGAVLEAFKALLLLCAAFVLQANFSVNFTVYASTAKVAEQTEVSITDNEIDYRQELYSLIGLAGKVDKKSGNLILSQKSGENVMCIEKQCFFGNEVFVCKFIYEGNFMLDETLPLRAINLSEVIKGNYYRPKLKYTIYIDAENVYIEGVDKKKYVLVNGELFDISKREKCSAEFKNYFVNLFSVLNRGTFGEYDMHILQDFRPYVNKEHVFDLIPYSNAYLVISETGARLSENKLIAEKLIHRFSAGAIGQIYDRWEERYKIPENTALLYANWYAGTGNDYIVEFYRDKNTAKVLCRTLVDGNDPDIEHVSKPFSIAEVNFNSPYLTVPVAMDERNIAGTLDAPIFLIQKEFMNFDDGDTVSGVYVNGDETPLTAVNLGLYTMYVYNFDQSAGNFTQNYYLSPNSAKDIKSLNGAEIGDTFEQIINKMGFGEVKDGCLTYEIGGLKYMFTAKFPNGETDALYVGYPR
ncbi:MAG: hypothetical protein LBS21_08375 [Clostridiales bacterium]|jgi:hypothetical protein|nr:hypothetical protein [Clostridiales bacterium]